MYQYYNPNPLKKSVGDCTVRALSKLLEISWDDAYDILCYYGAEECDMPDSNSVMVYTLKKMGYQREIIPNECPHCYTLRDFVSDHKKGEYIVAFGSHVVCVKNGTYFDSWDSGNEVPVYYFKREK